MKHGAFVLAGVVAIGLASPVNAEVAMTSASDGHDTVPVYVDGHGPYPFILDSGADSTAVYRWFAEKMRFKAVKGGDQELSGQTGTTKVTMYHVGDLKLDGHHLRNVEAYGLPNRHDAGREAGVLGNDFMDGRLVTYDFPCRRIAVHAKPVDVAKLVGPGAHVVHADSHKSSTLLTIPVTVNGATGTGIIDTGSRQTRLSPRFARAAGIDPESAKFRSAKAIYGANSKGMVPLTGPVGTVGFGGMTIRHAEAQIVALPFFEQEFKGKRVMLLGADLMGHYRVFYDHAASKIWFRPSQCKAAY